MGIFWFHKIWKRIQFAGHLTLTLPHVHAMNTRVRGTSCLIKTAMVHMKAGQGSGKLLGS